jgi:sensor domain CHASE-containing protein
MSLRSKIVIILFAVVVLYAALDRVIQETFVFKSFEVLEEVQAEQDLRRVVQAIQNEVRHLGVRCDDWATWDDTFAFIEDSRLAVEAADVAERIRHDDREKSYIVSNLVPECFHKNNLNLLYLCDASGKVVWGRALELEGDRDFALREFPSERLAPDHPLLAENSKVLVENLPAKFTAEELSNLFLPYGGVRAAEVSPSTTANSGPSPTSSPVPIGTSTTTTSSANVPASTSATSATSSTRPSTTSSAASSGKSSTAASTAPSTTPNENVASARSSTATSNATASTTSNTTPNAASNTTSNTATEAAPGRAHCAGWVRLDTPAMADAARIALSGKIIDGEPIAVRVSDVPGGLLMTERGPMLVSAKPILDSHRKGPARGTVIMGRLLSPELVAALAKQTGVDFAVWRVAEDDLPEAERQILSEVTAQNGDDAHVLRAAGDDKLLAYTTFADIREAPALLIRANIERDITARGATAARYALFSTIGASVLILSVLLHLLQRTVLRPIAALTEQAVAVGKSEDFTKKLDFDRSDEIGTLSREFETMMEKLADSRAALVKAARAAGMSEIATGVLHNVGNVLNSVNVSATLVADKARSAGLEDLKLALKTVQDSTGDLLTFVEKDPRGEHLYPLLKSLAKELESERETIAREAKTLTEGIEHIKELIQSQQSHAGRSGVLEMVSLQDEIDAAVNMTGQSIHGRAYQVVREFEDVGPRAIDRHRLKEILVNVIQNARQAMQAKEDASLAAASAANGSNAAPSATGSRLVLRLKSISDERVRIEVADNGVGISRENLSRIFTHGFTTKKTGHGFGLHASANAATEMGGSLKVESDGPGTGATFILEVPVAIHDVAGVCP